MQKISYMKILLNNVFDKRCAENGLWHFLTFVRGDYFGQTLVRDFEDHTFNYVKVLCAAGLMQLFFGIISWPLPISNQLIK